MTEPTSPIETEAFRKWFGGSQAVDESGKPLVLYHSSREDIRAFDPARTRDGGFHFGTLDQAKHRQEHHEGEHLIAVHLSVEKVFRAKDIGGFWQGTVEKAKREGYDAIVYLNRYEGTTADERARARHKGKGDETQLSDKQFRAIAPTAADSWIVFNPGHIKSATHNFGTFDATDPDITDDRARLAAQNQESGMVENANLDAGIALEIGDVPALEALRGKLDWARLAAESANNLSDYLTVPCYGTDNREGVRAAAVVMLKMAAEDNAFDLFKLTECDEGATSFVQPIFKLIDSDFPEALMVFLEQGFDPHQAYGIDGLTAIDVAEEQGNHGLAKTMRAFVARQKALDVTSQILDSKCRP